MNLPIEFKERMKSLLGEDYDAFIESFNNEPARSFRVNKNKISLSDWEKIDNLSTKKLSYSETAFLTETEKIGSSPFHHAGMIYSQDPAAICPAESVDINPDWVCLDLCAAPGGKATQIKDKLGESTLLVANEINPSRCKILVSNIERMGIKNTVVTNRDSRYFAENFPSFFDFIMVDAPCSGEGMFRKDPEAITEWHPSSPEKCAVRQTEILENAAEALRGGGIIVYSTCTYSVEENEKAVLAFLENHPEFSLTPVTERVEAVTEAGIGLPLARRFYPHKSKGEGQFMAVLKNNSLPSPRFLTPQKETAKNKDLIKFLEETLVSFNKEDLITENDKAFLLKSEYNLFKGAFLKGVTIGEIKKGYILPHHQFFSTFGKDFKRKIELSETPETLIKYLGGEEFETQTENGWAAVTLYGAPVGGVKVSGGRAKNHYPKGLRIMG